MVFYDERSSIAQSIVNLQKLLGINIAVRDCRNLIMSVKFPFQINDFFKSIDISQGTTFRIADF